jgi:magnesium chelatase subunit D
MFSAMVMPALHDATWAVGLLALAPSMFNGALIDHGGRDAFLGAYALACGGSPSIRTASSSMTHEVLTGALDLASTLAAGRPIYSRGILDTIDRDLLLVNSVERLDPGCVALIAEALDHGELALVGTFDARNDDIPPASTLSERLAFLITDDAQNYWTAEVIASARERLELIVISDDLLQEMCIAALAVGITSLRTALQAVAAARGITALQGEVSVSSSSAAIAARLILAQRARHAPASDTVPQDMPPPEPEAEDGVNEEQIIKDPANAEVVLDAVRAALPQSLLAQTASGASRAASRSRGTSNMKSSVGMRGRRIGSRPARSLSGLRLDILATLRQAAPWQKLRHRFMRGDRLAILRDDFRVPRIKQRSEATAIFAVDASGSTAFQRLAEAKGAVEAILAECYVRRDKVAMVAFRSKGADVLLPPTRSLERARRALNALPGGGGTPLAAGLDAAFELCIQVKRDGATPIVILLTDGRANVTRTGEGNRVKALEESRSAARLFVAQGIDCMLIDVAPDPQKSARELAAIMHANYIALPRASAAEIAKPVARALRQVSS